MNIHNNKWCYICLAYYTSLLCLSLFVLIHIQYTVERDL